MAHRATTRGSLTSELGEVRQSDDDRASTHAAPVDPDEGSGAAGRGLIDHDRRLGASGRGLIDRDDPAGARLDGGLFGPGSEAWRLDREAMLLLGAGPRALLMQIAHPQVAAGVDEHSDFRADPWRRLDGTLRSYLRIIYGSTAAARAEVRRLNALHRSVTGAGYAARDPALSLWVHATLIDATIVAYDAWLESLAEARAARFYAETLPLGRAFGVPEGLLPPNLAAFRAYLADQLGPDGPVHPGPTARTLAGSILHPPLPGALARVPVAPRWYDWALWPSIGLLPSTIRAEYGFPWGPRERWVSRWLVAGWRAWRPFLPPWFRQMPQALAADRRMARSVPSTR